MEEEPALPEGLANLAERSRNQSADDRSGLLEDEVIFNEEGAKLDDEEEERQDEVVPFPSTHNPVSGLNRDQHGTEAEDGLLGEEDDEEIELGPRARAALSEPKAHDILFN